MGLSIQNKAKEKTALLSLGLSVVVGVLLVAWPFVYAYINSSIIALGEFDDATPPAALVVAPEWIPAPPERLVIPAIAVDTAIELVGLASDGTATMGVPSRVDTVGWYKHGVRPGMRGSAVIAGHRSGKGVPEAVFYDLRTLEIGDEVVIMSADRIEDIFQVVRIETYDFDADTAEVFVSNDGTARLNLITCGGEWLPDEKVFDQRVVVFTELVTDVE
jgi:sortase (surface protein transpeptidase)